jgi:hypothetical protein
MLLIRNSVFQGILRVLVRTIKIIKCTTKTTITINLITAIKLNSGGTIRRTTRVNTTRITIRNTTVTSLTMADTISLFPCIQAPEFTRLCLKNRRKRQFRTT